MPIKPKTRSHLRRCAALARWRITCSLLGKRWARWACTGIDIRVAASGTSSLDCQGELRSSTARQHHLFDSHLPGTSARSLPGSWLIFAQPFGRAKCYNLLQVLFCCRCGSEQRVSLQVQGEGPRCKIAWLPASRLLVLLFVLCVARSVLGPDARSTQSRCAI